MIFVRLGAIEQRLVSTQNSVDMGVIRTINLLGAEIIDLNSAITSSLSEVSDHLYDIESNTNRISY